MPAAESPFTVLGLPETAAASEVKARWRKLCALHHPDRPTGNYVEFDRVAKAYKLAYAEALRPKPCPVCDGTGSVVKVNGIHSLKLVCQGCGGTGKKM